jgi:gliding motility associated protien GldN
MSKTTWEIIDLSEKINFPLYFPIDTANIGPDRRSLYDVLIKGIKKGKITEVYSDSYFNTKKSFKDITASLSRIDTTDAGREQLNAGSKISPEYIVQQDITSQDVTQYKIKGVWYFDKRQSEMKYRLLGICPVTPDVYTMNTEEPDFIELFWVFFPDARETLHRATAFNEKNSSMPITFDQILNSRRFNSIIYKEENVYGDREIKDYMKDNAQNQLLESDRVKDKIRSFEQDMWNY